ncbi:nuclear transport factor 2 family protein [Amycolatopsis sp. H20-H5]|uniref:nuclear transport factor 2 family protein n=1 Tax=Amycolatopsis sp. H20-H5 TaxID=3046309 RepID=UPI002DBE4370|nr:nuclear transport factor 2 family protein [Amycolatopsis sp. H20-H5]MEC3977528.1 nuclear transport factor 2 family protein [Amycolatopsis sp. H20-H5]
MGKNTREVVEAYLGHLGNGEVEAAVALLAEPLDWFTPGSTTLIPWMGQRSTKDEVRTFFSMAGEHMTAENFAVSRILADGELAIVLGSFKYKVNATGKSFESDFALEVRVTDGLIDRYHMHEDSYAIHLAFL